MSGSNPHSESGSTLATGAEKINRETNPKEERELSGDETSAWLSSEGAAPSERGRRTASLQ